MGALKVSYAVCVCARARVSIAASGGDPGPTGSSRCKTSSHRTGQNPLGALWVRTICSLLVALNAAVCQHGDDRVNRGLVCGSRSSSPAGYLALSQQTLVVVRSSRLCSCSLWATIQPHMVWVDFGHMGTHAQMLAVHKAAVSDEEISVSRLVSCCSLCELPRQANADASRQTAKCGLANLLVELWSCTCPSILMDIRLCVQPLITVRPATPMSPPTHSSPGDPPHAKEGPSPVGTK